MTQRSRIFISYSHKDRDRADFLWDELRARGHEVFIDREGILETELITARIRDMMQGSDVVVLVLGPNWITSPACAASIAGWMSVKSTPGPPSSSTRHVLSAGRRAMITRAMSL